MVHVTDCCWPMLLLCWPLAVTVLALVHLTNWD
jgi:hypothetical protein